LYLGLLQQPFSPSQTLYISCDHAVFKDVSLFELVEFAQQGDFVVDEKWVFEIGGKSKDFSQLKKVKRDAYLALDSIEVGSERKIPLWLFGMLY
jgi:hypothetical protein